MSSTRPRVEAALKGVVVPYLRSRGFRGSFPSFQRRRDRCIQLVEFQFHRYREAFAVNVGAILEGEILSAVPKGLSEQKIRASHLPLDRRLRLGSTPPGRRDHWFSFEAEADATLNIVAETVVRLLREQANAYWDHFLSSEEGAAEPGVTDNNDDAQRLREDHGVRISPAGCLSFIGEPKTLTSRARLYIVAS